MFRDVWNYFQSDAWHSYLVRFLILFVIALLVGYIASLLR